MRAQEIAIPFGRNQRAGTASPPPSTSQAKLEGWGRRRRPIVSLHLTQFVVVAQAIHVANWPIAQAAKNNSSGRCKAGEGGHAMLAHRLPWPPADRRARARSGSCCQGRTYRPGPAPLCIRAVAGREPVQAGLFVVRRRPPHLAALGVERAPRPR